MVIHHPAKFGAISIMVVEYSFFRLSYNFARPRDYRVMWLNALEPLTVSHCPVKFGGHRHCGSRDIMLLVVEAHACLIPLLLFFSKAHGMS